MNKNDFKNPLIQSGAILLVVFLLISIVAGSGSQGLLGSIGALISGIFSAVIFVVALCIAIVFSIAVIIGVYLAAVSFYSRDKGRDLFEQLKKSLGEIYGKVRGTKIKYQASAPKPAESKPESEKVAETIPPPEPQPEQQPQAEPLARQASPPEDKLDAVNSKLSELTRTSSVNDEKIAGIQRRIDTLASGAGQEEKLAGFENSLAEVSDQFKVLSTKVEAVSTEVQNLQLRIDEEISGIKNELAALHDKTSVPEVISGILSYIDSPEDRDMITAKATEAISRGMTYSQIDDFFKASLSAEVYQELAAHPRLTKDFLRSIKKKF